MQDISRETQIVTDQIDPARATALLVALSSESTLVAGDPLPPFFHHLYFWDLFNHRLGWVAMVIQRLVD